MPLWALQVLYAEQFGGDPQDVSKRVKVVWWERWRTWEQARASRVAYSASEHVDDWTRDLTPDARAAMGWAVEKETAD